MRAFRLAYDGRPFYGFQRQPDVPTVEDALFDALATLGVHDADARKPEGYAAAGRTDAGVSAVAQTVAFEAPDWLTPAALGSELPASVRPWASAEAPDGFHATHDAARRTYRYHLHLPAFDERGGRRPGDADAGSSDAPGPPDPAAALSRAREAAAALSGEHDFHNLTPDAEGTVRDLDCSVVRDGAFLVVRAAADGFPREFVRRLASVVRGVATGATDRDRVARVLSAEHLSGPAGVAAAPAEPLVLAGVTYPGLAFGTDPDAAESVRAVFDRKRRAGLVRARTATDVLNAL
ncbi:tRNA pseudouridine(38-40) synthase TruA [Candidatus Halobonum tyrrellensis]|uniref:tRNA pseudouridine synthase A n=1 Tax=Candidatus Halobonum tyrrellensis G22 TaxID=1324957 RepID=V4HHK3_9EURY|nr:tRNA pseudouridine(38-40) synthase TruA [Candidatus Halobonum tyrrellensis]ESP87339.1 tRNA pseudouridine synthase A [Candidatus Halobonum tyrrellensis G22]